LPRALRIVAAIHELSDSQGEIQVGAQSLIYAARGTARGGIVLVRGAGLAFAEWRPFLASLILAGLGGALLAAVASFLLARRLIRPIAVLSDATTRVAAGEQRVDVPVAGEDELAQLARSFNLMSESLARARETQRDFLESVSHELKTPLTSIRGYAEALGDGAVEPAQASAVIGAEAGRLERLVSDLLDLARLQRAGFAVERERVDLSNIVERAVERHRLRARELNVELTGSSNGPALGVGDPDRLLQATSNLIENALRITPAGGSVSATARAGEIEVQDTGPGLAPDDLPHAFERFYLYERYRSEREVGSGLGLAIVGELAARMGGGIAVENVDGGGARFTLRVPQP
jgi:two-component system sensor histidine kinase BaeS